MKMKGEEQAATGLMACCFRNRKDQGTLFLKGLEAPTSTRPQRKFLTAGSDYIYTPLLQYYLSVYRL